MTEGIASYQKGRLSINQRGVRLAPALFFFGERFRLDWSSIRSWAVSDISVIVPSTGAECVTQRLIELHTAQQLFTLPRKADDPDLATILALLQQYLPDKRVMGMIGNLPH